MVQVTSPSVLVTEGLLFGNCTSTGIESGPSGPKPWQQSVQQQLHAGEGAYELGPANEQGLCEQGLEYYAPGCASMVTANDEQQTCAGQQLSGSGFSVGQLDQPLPMFPTGVLLQQPQQQQEFAQKEPHYGISISGSEDEASAPFFSVPANQVAYDGSVWGPSGLQQGVPEAGFSGDFAAMLMTDSAFGVDTEGSFDDILSGPCFQSSSCAEPFSSSIASLSLSGAVDEGTLLFDLEEPFVDADADMLQEAMPRAFDGETCTDAVEDDDVLLPSSPSSRGDSCPLSPRDVMPWGHLASSGPSERSVATLARVHMLPAPETVARHETQLPGSPRSDHTSLVTIPSAAQSPRQQHQQQDGAAQEQEVAIGHAKVVKSALQRSPGTVGGLANRGHHGSGASKFGGPCMHCGATESPQWRRGPDDKPMLCNACGTRYRRSNQLGPVPGPQAPKGVHKKKAGSQSRWTGGRGRARKAYS